MENVDEGGQGEVGWGGGGRQKGNNSESDLSRSDKEMSV